MRDAKIFRIVCLCFETTRFTCLSRPTLASQSRLFPSPHPFHLQQLSGLLRMSESKEKKDKEKKPKEKKDKDGSPAGESKEKSGKKEKSDKKDKKSDSAAAESKDVKVVGSTTYQRKKVKLDADGTSKIIWLPQGRQLSDKQYAWQEIKNPAGEDYYANMADPQKRVWELPDLGGDGSASAAAAGGSSAAAGASGTNPVLEKKKFKERKEWKEDAAKKPVIAFVKKALQQALKSDQINNDEYTILSANISKEYMSLFKKFDGDGEQWVTDAVTSQLASLAASKRTSTMGGRTAEPTRSVIGHLVKDSELPLPTAPAVTKSFPVSLFMSKAFYLRDAFYYRRIHVANPRRSRLEATLEEVTFLQPGAGTLRVLCAVPCRLGSQADKPIVAAVVRDWVGAYCFMLIDPPNEMGESVVTAAYPLLQFVDFPSPGYSKIPVAIDDQVFILSFRDQDSATYLNESLKIAMCSMFGVGSDDELIISMRAYSIEFSSQDTCYYPSGTIPDANAVLRGVLSESARDTAALEADFQLLRLCMRTPEGRDMVLRTWIRSLDEGVVFKKKSPAMTNNHLRVIEEAILMPAFHEDTTIPQHVVARLSLMKSDQSDEIRNRIETIKASFRIVTSTMDRWKSRTEMPDKPFESCFLPVEGSTGAQYEDVAMANRRLKYARSQVPPGIYLTMLSYCGNSVLCDSLGNLFSEVIVQNPTEVELNTLTPEHEDFRWALSLGGGTENWVDDINAWAEVYDNAGRQTFRARFLHAARRLLESYSFSTLGVIFDVPVILRQVSCGHIICVSKLPTRESVPQALGEWRNLSDFETQLYLQTCITSPSTRLSFLPSGYYDCQRFVKAAIDYREMLLRRLPPGFYVGLLVAAPSSSGRVMLLPEENRLLPPLVHVWDEMPTLDQWRWIQGLNERKRRTRSFTLDFAKSGATGGPAAAAGEPTIAAITPATFEQRFAKAIKDLETAVGLPIEKIFDHEMFSMDEGGQCRCVFAVHRVSSGIVQMDHNGATVSGTSLSAAGPGAGGSQVSGTGQLHAPSRLRLAPPVGAVRCVWKHIDSYELSYFKILWPRVFIPMLDERAAHYRRAFSTCQPFSVDEVCRLQQDSALACYCDVDKYALLVSWARQVTTWLFRDGRTLVEAFGGDDDESVARSVEEAVEVAVSNHATSQDINVQTMKSLLQEAASSLHFSWPTFLSKLREIDRVISLGYSQRLDPGTSRAVAPKKLRTYDEVYSDPDSDDERIRAPTVYELPCTLEEMILKDVSAQDSEKYFHMQDIVQDIVDLACIDSVDVGAVKEVGNIVMDMISVIESTEDLLDKASLMSMKQATEEAALQERQTFQQQWLDVFQNDRELMDHASKRPNDNGMGGPNGGGAGVGGGGGNGSRSASEARNQALEDDDLDAPLMPPLFYDGSSRIITSVQDGLRYCVAQTGDSCHKLSQLLKSANSAMEALDITQCIQEFATLLNKRQALVRRDTPGADAASGGSPMRSPSFGGGQVPSADSIVVTVVSKEFVEMPVQTVDPLRCLVLHGVTGKVRFPTLAAETLQILVDHLNCPDYNVQHALASYGSLDRGVIERLMETALQMKAPIIALRTAVLLFATKQGPSYFFTAGAANQIRTLFSEGFLFEYGIKDWLHIEILGGDAIAPAMDVVWWIRFLNEAAADQSSGGTLSRREAFADHEGCWKQVYAETRVRVFLSFGVHAISKEEATLWGHSLGRYVEYLSLRDTSAGDPEVEILASTCPNLKSLDLSNSSVTGHGLDLLMQHCQQLVECSVAGCEIRPDVQEGLRRHCAECRRRASVA